MRTKLCAFALLIVSIGCASASPRHQATVTSGIVYEALATMQDVEHELYASGQVTASDHQKFAGELQKALIAGQQFNKAVEVWPAGDAPPDRVRAFADQVVAASEAALRALPLGVPRDALSLRVLAVERAVIDLLLTR